MADAGARLSIDFWHTTVAAAVRFPDGRVVAVTVDGAAVSPVGVAVADDGGLWTGRDGADIGTRNPQSYVRMPGHRLLHDLVTVGPVQVDPVDLVSATVAKVAREARVVAGVAPREVVVSIPAGWVARQRRGMRTAAERAGLGAPRLVSGAESIVREQMTRGAVVPVGSVVVACRLDATVGELAVLRRTAEGFDPLATPDLGELGEMPGATLTEQAAAALARVLDAANLGGDQVGAVFCQAPMGVMAELSDALTAAAGLTVAPLQVADLAAAFGGARPAAPDPDPATTRRTGGGLVGSAIAAAVGWSAAAVLTYQVVSSGTVYRDTPARGTWLDTEWYVWGLAPVFAILGAVSLCLVVADLRAGRRRVPGAAAAGPDPALGSALLLVAVFGVGAAGALGLIGAQHFEIEPGHLLRWTLSLSAPLAAVLAAAALVVARVDPPATASTHRQAPWRDRLRFPLAALALAAVSTATMVASYVGVPYVDPQLWTRMERVGAFFLGWAVALLLATDGWRRVILGFLLSTTGAYAISIDTAGVIASCLVGAITLWWLQRLAPVALPILARRPAPSHARAADQPIGGAGAAS